MKIKFSLTIGLIILAICSLFYFLGDLVFSFLRDVLSPVLFGNNTFLEYLEIIAYVLVLAYLVGRLGQMKIGKNSIMRKIPIFGVLLGQMEILREVLSGHGGFVRVLDYPGPGHNTIGIITGKLPIVDENEQKESFPKIYIPSPPNPSSGQLDMPAREKLQKINVKGRLILQIFFTLGLMGPDRLQITRGDDKDLDYYYSTD